MSNNKTIRASEIGMYVFCPKSFLLLRQGVPAQQTLQDLIEQKMIPAPVARQLQQQNIPVSTTVDKLIEKHILPASVEKEIIKQNILLQGSAMHEKIGERTQAGAGTQEHRGLWVFILLIIMAIIGFLVLLTVRGAAP